MLQSDDPATRTLLAVQRYDNLLSQINDVTLDLAAAIDSWNPETVERLLEVRKNLGEQIGPCARSLAHEVHSCKANGHYNTSLEDTLSQLETRQNILLLKQIECETALTEKLNECKKSLLDINQHKELRRTYNGYVKAEDARFLDIKQ
ncbi:MAG TPA: hypothetical protein PKV43_06890 [Armatimonadota bacterium]|nr:hypothetical protein [Armatimonadota bacterium]